MGWRFEALAADILLIVAAVVFIDYLVPFVSTHGGGNEAALAMALLVYALSITSKVDDDGINSLQIDDSESGLRKRFTIWVAAFAVAAGIAVSKGLSWPEYLKDWDGDGKRDLVGGSEYGRIVGIVTSVKTTNRNFQPHDNSWRIPALSGSRRGTSPRCTAVARK